MTRVLLLSNNELSCNDIRRRGAQHEGVGLESLASHTNGINPHRLDHLVTQAIKVY